MAGEPLNLASSKNSHGRQQGVGNEAAGGGTHQAGDPKSTRAARVPKNQRVNAQSAPGAAPTSSSGYVGASKGSMTAVKRTSSGAKHASTKAVSAQHNRNAGVDE